MNLEIKLDNVANSESVSSRLESSFCSFQSAECPIILLSASGFTRGTSLAFDFLYIVGILLVPW